MAHLEVKSLCVDYKELKAVSEISFEANRGEIIGLIGADGAGKSTLMLCIAGIISFEGSISFEGELYHNPKEANKIKSLFGLMPQGIGLVLYETLTVEEHLEFFADIRNIKKDSKFQEYKKRLLLMSGLDNFRDREAGKLSGGMMQKLSLICTLLHRPKLLILDEPTTGVDPLSRLELWDILDNIRKEEGSIILVSTAYMQEASKMDRVMLFDEGKIIAQGTAEELLDSIKEQTYTIQESSQANIISFDKRSYSLEPLNAEHTKPTLEGLFFINALKQNRALPPIEIEQREKLQEIPEVVMRADKISKKFGSFIANDSVDISLKRGEILGLLGANGAGKTTFIKMLLGLYPIDAGELHLLGKRISTQDDRQGLKSKIGYVSQHFALYNDMTVRENLIYFANMHQIPLSTTKQRIKKYAYELGFEHYMDKFPTELPLGVNQRFSIATALLHEPVILFLDEPTSGVDTIARAQFWKILHRLKELWGISILITTHYMSEAEYCDRVVLLKQGKKVADDSVENLYKSHPNATTFEDIFLDYFRSQS